MEGVYTRQRVLLFRLDEDSAALHESSAQPSIFLAEAVVQPRKKSWGYFDQEILNAALVVNPLSSVNRPH